MLTHHLCDTDYKCLHLIQQVAGANHKGAGVSEVSSSNTGNKLTVAICEARCCSNYRSLYAKAADRVQLEVGFCSF